MNSTRSGAAIVMLLAVTGCGRAPEAPPAAAAVPDLAEYDIARLQRSTRGA
jgi:predicted small lipoprotein YifL